MEKKWVFQQSADEEQARSLAESLKVNLLMAKLLIQRGLTTEIAARKFFQPDLLDLHDPFLMKDMNLAVERIMLAIEAKEKILLFGDYDVDGTTAVACMFEQLSKVHENILYYIPDRYKEGYGLSSAGIEFAQKNKCSLVITLDCGIKSTTLIDDAKKCGIDFIVCDHHEPGVILPNAIVLDPKRKDCAYPYKELSGCGVGFKLLQALFQKLELPETLLYESLDLLALSIGADIVEITGENRILCYHGLKVLNKHPRLAFQELLKLAGKKLPLTLTDVVFIVAPRINAAGRIRSGKMAVDWMLSQDHQEIIKLAEEIHADNALRKTIDQTMTKEALKQISMDQGHPMRYTSVVFQADWHKGVVGIVASRLIETYFRPTIVLTESNGILTGSARSVGQVNMYQILDACSEFLIQFGGHHFAAGLSLKKENLERFKEAFEQEVKKCLKEMTLQQSQNIDLEIEFNDFQLESNGKLPRMMKILDAMEPFGPGNMKPIFYSREVYAKDSILLKEKHLKLKLIQKDSHCCYDAIGFNLSSKEQLTLKGLAFDLAYTLEKNEFMGNVKLQLNVQDIRPH